MNFIVTAGGSGTKLWPYSRQHKPKQFQPILGDQSLFAQNIGILLRKHSPRNIFVSTKRKFLPFAIEQAPAIPMENFIVEPDIAKNRGPAEGLAFVYLMNKRPHEPFMIIQSDCLRAPEDQFLAMIDHAKMLLERDGKFISSGIKATTPTLGVDYLKLDSKLEGINDMDIYAVDQFVERTNDYASTKTLVKDFTITTHCNHNAWYPEKMLDAYQTYHPEWYDALMQIKDAFGTHNEQQTIEAIYTTMPEGATEEVTKHIFSEGYIILLPFTWVDFGTWESIFDHQANHHDDNVHDGKILQLNSTGCLIKSVHKDKLIAAYGIDDLVIVDTDDILYIAPRGESNAAKFLQKELPSTTYL